MKIPKANLPTSSSSTSISSYGRSKKNKFYKYMRRCLNGKYVKLLCRVVNNSSPTNPITSFFNQSSSSATKLDLSTTAINLSFESTRHSNEYMKLAGKQDYADVDFMCEMLNYYNSVQMYKSNHELENAIDRPTIFSADASNCLRTHTDFLHSLPMITQSKVFTFTKAYNVFTNNYCIIKQTNSLDNKHCTSTIKTTTKYQHSVGKQASSMAKRLNQMTRRVKQDLQYEIMALTALEPAHDNIIQSDSQWLEEQSINVSLEYGIAGSLDQLLRQKIQMKPLHEHEMHEICRKNRSLVTLLWYIAISLACGLVYMHRRGNMIHDDLRTPNVFVGLSRSDRKNFISDYKELAKACHCGNWSNMRFIIADFGRARRIDKILSRSNTAAIGNGSSMQNIFNICIRDWRNCQKIVDECYERIERLIDPKYLEMLNDKHKKIIELLTPRLDTNVDLLHELCNLCNDGDADNSDLVPIGFDQTMDYLEQAPQPSTWADLLNQGALILKKARQDKKAMKTPPIVNGNLFDQEDDEDFLAYPSLFDSPGSSRRPSQSPPTPPPSVKKNEPQPANYISDYLTSSDDDDDL